MLRWDSAPRYWDAVAHMHARQLLFRLRRAVPDRVLGMGLERGSAPGWRPLATGTGISTAPASTAASPPHQSLEWGSVGHRRSFGSNDFWFRTSDGLLFLFNLHGFGELARYAAGHRTPTGDEVWERVVRDWLGRCGAPHGPAWHPYPTSERIVAWCAALSTDALLVPVSEQMRASLWLQLRWLSRCVEHDIGGNHVLRNAAALVIGGECLGDSQTVGRGLKLLRRELARQVLADGGHEERSPSYHRQVHDDLEDVCVVERRANGQVPDWLQRTTARMGDWLTAIAGPGGDIPALNDGWDGPPLELASQRAPARDLAASGYLALQDGGTQAVLDLGPLGPAHLPAHAHADALSLVLWADRRPVLVDRGSYSYAGPERDAYRGTAAHNTLTVDGRDQCTLWKGFRASFMPTVQREQLRARSNAITVRATHDGFSLGDEVVIHERTFVWLGADGVVVVDRLRAKRPHQTVSRLHFHESVADPLGELPGDLRYTALGEGTPPRVEPSARSPAFGVAVEICLISRAARLAPGSMSGFALTRAVVEVHLSDTHILVARPGLAELAVGFPSELS